MTTDYDIILVQEHWLFPDELAYMSNLSCNFNSFSVTSVTIEDKLHRGRPYGGVTITITITITNSLLRQLSYSV